MPERVESSLRLRGLDVAVIGRSGRLRGVVDFEVRVGGRHLAYVRVFRGRPPYYVGWVEVYGVEWGLRAAFEALVEAIAEVLEPGERLYVEYVGERELERRLQYVEPEDTWLGRLLLRLGLTGLKDMYYPEGFAEGGPKVKAEKPRKRVTG